ncbi:hypothetical protein ACFC1L_39820 [Streptomyces sp. NPDC056210]|uniref:hypothetical protein n=1 Tax=Streptomyces sp. NPDC056210 TaxID=3345746 RepID=UPI0035D74F6A
MTKTHEKLMTLLNAGFKLSTTEIIGMAGNNGTRRMRELYPVYEEKGMRIVKEKSPDERDFLYWLEGVSK